MNLIFLITACQRTDDRTYAVLKEVFGSEKLNKNPKLPEIKRRLSLLGELVTRAVLSELTGLEMSSFIRREQLHGKPYFEGFEDFYFNISHSESFLAVAVADGNVGIDIEAVKEPDLSVVKRLAVGEREYILENPELGAMRFYEIWTKKEAFLKRTGEGISCLLSSFDVTSEEIAKSIFYFTENGYTVSVCTEILKDNFTIVRLGERELIAAIAEKGLINLENQNK